MPEQLFLPRTRRPRCDYRLHNRDPNHSSQSTGEIMSEASELRQMSDEQLALTLREAADDFFRLRLKAQTERLDAPSELRRQRRLVAQVKTIQREREIAAAKAAAAPAE